MRELLLTIEEKYNEAKTHIRGKASFDGANIKIGGASYEVHEIFSHRIKEIIESTGCFDVHLSVFIEDGVISGVLDSEIWFKDIEYELNGVNFNYTTKKFDKIVEYKDKIEVHFGNIKQTFSFQSGCSIENCNIDTSYTQYAEEDDITVIRGVSNGNEYYNLIIHGVVPWGHVYDNPHVEVSEDYWHPGRYFIEAELFGDKMRLFNMEEGWCE